jgi:hypothetical protein
MQTEIDHPAHKKLVAIIIDDKPYEVDTGKYLVSKLKEIGHVPAGDELAHLVHGKLVVLPDDAEFHIKGGEIFVSHPKKGHSS